MVWLVARIGELRCVDRPAAVRREAHRAWCPRLTRGRTFADLPWLRRPTHGPHRHALGQRDELLLVARHFAEAARLPIGLRLLDPLAGGGDEVPEQVPRAVHRRAAEEQHAG